MLYYVHNTSRSINKRLQRYASPSHRGLVQFIEGQRIVRGRPIILTEEGLLRNEAVIRKGIEDGYLELRTADGRLIDPKTYEVQAPTPAAKEIPIVVPDSAKNDKPSGIPMPIYPLGAVQSTTPPEQEQEYEDPAANASPHQPPAAALDDDEVEIEHTESGSGVRKSGKRGRR